ncbi:MAG: hypothetical protein CL587_16085 [Alteromonadaceae bacterium]|nr:hypothetical protein [Alteromonadaceae bacterium]
MIECAAKICAVNAVPVKRIFTVTARSCGPFQAVSSAVTGKLSRKTFIRTPHGMYLCILRGRTAARYEYD